MSPVQRFHWDSAAYAEACAAPVRCAGARVYERQILRELCAAFPAASHAIDGGAGGGDRTSLLVEHCQQVYAGEPHPARCVVRATRCPRVQIVDGTLMSAVLPMQMDVGLISYMLYYIPDHTWGTSTIHAAQHLTANGVLMVTSQRWIRGVIRCSSIVGRLAMTARGAHAV